MSTLIDDPEFSFKAHGGYEETSGASGRYNSIAWAAGEVCRKWWPDGMGVAYWPSGVPRRETIQAFEAAFGQLGYGRCDSDALEPGFEKVAIFAIAGAPKHAARQIVSGKHSGLWTSKMGDDIDVVHKLSAVCGPCYGAVALLLRRQVSRRRRAHRTGGSP